MSPFLTNTLIKWSQKGMILTEKQSHLSSILEKEVCKSMQWQFSMDKLLVTSVQAHAMVVQHGQTDSDEFC